MLTAAPDERRVGLLERIDKAVFTVNTGDRRGFGGPFAIGTKRIDTEFGGFGSITGTTWNRIGFIGTQASGSA